MLLFEPYYTYEVVLVDFWTAEVVFKNIYCIFSKKKKKKTQIRTLLDT